MEEAEDIGDKEVQVNKGSNIVINCCYSSIEMVDNSYKYSGGEFVYVNIQWMTISLLN